MKQETGSISDGYHTFDELYEHRHILYLNLCKQITRQPYDDDVRWKVWKSTKHSDGEKCFGGDEWFVLGIGTGIGYQITYHLPMKYWEFAHFADTLEKAPLYDGHTSDDVLKRLLREIN